MAGTFIDLYGDVRLDARLVDVGDGNVSKVVRSDPKLTDRRQLFRIIQSVAERVVEAVRAATLRSSPATVWPMSISARVSSQPSARTGI